MGADGVDWKIKLVVKNVAILKEQGAEGLVLGGGGHLIVDGQVGEKGLDFSRAHVAGVTFMVKEDVAFDPAEVACFGAVGVMFEAEGVADLV